MLVVIEADVVLLWLLSTAILYCLLTVQAHMASVNSQLSNISKPGQEMKVTSEWRLDCLFRGYAAKMTEE